MHLRGNAAGVLVTLLVVGGVATACGSGSGATTSTTSTTAPVASAGKAPSLSLLTSSVQAQVTGTGPSDFSVGGVTKLTCTPPTDWTVGATFTCMAYDFASDELGVYDGTVQSAVKGVPQWNGLWSPR